MALCIPTKKLSEIGNVYKEIDKDHGGSVSTDELVDGMMEFNAKQGTNVPREELKKIFSAMDFD
jgi:Ca2+-binding EF-hand superfamily protein